MRCQSDFVIGPVGEIYSCWEYIGYKEFIIGQLREDGIPEIKNEPAYLRYLVDADYLNDKTCNECFSFPVCHGGCPEKRIRNKHCNAQFDCCIIQKDDMENILDFHYEVKKQ